MYVHKPGVQKFSCALSLRDQKLGPSRICSDVAVPIS